VNLSAVQMRDHAHGHLQPYKHAEIRTQSVRSLRKLSISNLDFRGRDQGV
jgi:hypothetical protein